MTRRELTAWLTIAVLLGAVGGFCVCWGLKPPRVYVFQVTETEAIPVPWDALMCEQHNFLNGDNDD